MPSSNQRAIQARLEVGIPNDPFEQEAESVADTVMRAPAAPAKDAPKKDEDKKVARAAEPKKDAPKKDDDKKVQRAPSSPAVPEVTPQIEEGIEHTRGSGRPLPTAERERLEPSLGADLSGVRVHTDALAAGMADDLEAQAFTTGQDVYFAEGRYQPHTAEGRRLLAHEVTHTVQQSSGEAVGRVQRTNGTTGSAGGADTGAPAAAGPQVAAPGAKLPDMPAPAKGDPDLDLTQATTPLPWLGGKVTAPGQALEFDWIQIPEVKKQAPGWETQWGKGALKKPKDFSRGNQQDSDWRQKVGLDNGTVRDSFRAALKQQIAKQQTSPGEPVEIEDNVYYVVDGGHGNKVQARPPALAAHFSTPTWADGGKKASSPYQVDHIRELQLADYKQGGGHWADDPENLWLLDGPTNGQSGTKILGALRGSLLGFRQRIEKYYRLREEAEQGTKKGTKEPAMKKMRDALTKSGDSALLSVEDAYKTYDLTYLKIKPDGEPGKVEDTKFWSRKAIQDGEHLKWVKVPKVGVEDGHIVVFVNTVSATPQAAPPPPPAPGVPPSPQAPPAAQDVEGVGFDFNAKKGSPLTPRERLQFLPPLAVDDKKLAASPAGASYGTLTMGFPKGSDLEFPPGTSGLDLEVTKVEGLKGGARIDKTAVAGLLTKARYRHASPIEITSSEISPGRGFQMRGVIRADAPLLREGIDFEVAGPDIRVFKSFGLGAFEVPKPLTIYGTTLTISAGTKTGLIIGGQIDFAIEKVGSGFLAAEAGTKSGFALSGGFDFDSKLFDPATIKMAYRDDKWSGEGEIGIPKGRLKGVDKASVKVSYAEGKLEATGTADLSVPGVQKAGLGVVYSEADGLTISGDVTLRDDIPGIRSGSGKAQIRQLPDGSWEVAASGEAEPAIPGIDAKIKFDYAAGALTVEGSASYARGMLAGSLSVGATNRPIGEDGKPSAGEPTETLTAYGGGQVTVKLTPWLQGSVGIRLLPNGEIELSGAIALPSTLDLFPAKTYDKNLFKIGIDIPIIGVAVLGQRIGIFATVAGGLDFSAGVGPGQLQELSLEITYNPDHEDQTHIGGGAKLHVPAQAGLRLFVRAGLGVGIPIVSASLSLEIGAALGIEAALDAGVHVDWTPTTGLVLDAAAEVYAQPKFKFDISGVALVEADLLLTTVELYEKRWKFAEFEYGSGLRLGMKVPIHYEEGKPFDVTWDQVEFQTPDIDPMELLSGLVEEIA